MPRSRSASIARRLLQLLGLSRAKPPKRATRSKPSHRKDSRSRRQGRARKVATRIFISFDYDHDHDLKNALVGQAKLPDSPFEIADWSIKEPSADWKEKARARIRRADVVAVICGHRTDTAI